MLNCINLCLYLSENVGFIPNSASYLIGLHTYLILSLFPFNFTLSIILYNECEVCTYPDVGIQRDIGKEKIDKDYMLWAPLTPITVPMFCCPACPKSFTVALDI